MAKQTRRYDIQDGLYIYLQDNSANWYARFVIDGKWYAKGTKKKDQSAAEKRASELLAEYRLMLEHDIPIKRSKRARKYLFPVVADLAIERMSSELAAGNGRVIFSDYIQALNKYHKEFFKDCSILDIDQQLLADFDTWRIQKLGRVPAKSTVLNHNAAFNRVFDEAVILGFMVPTQVPQLKNSGVVGERRAAFSEEEFERLEKKAYEFVGQAITEKSKMIRELVRDYIVVAANSGIRPGTEMENITWGDIAMRRNGEVMVFDITVRKGKTHSYTGSRKVVCFEGVLLALMNLQEIFPDRKPSDKVFRLADGTESTQIGKVFSQLLKAAGLEYSSEGKRTLYSLRHSYITWGLKRKVPAQVLAIQCGTSLEMLEQFYSHVTPEMFTNELAGVAFSDPEKELQRLEPEHDQELIDMTIEFIDEWEAEFKSRGCI